MAKTRKTAPVPSAQPEQGDLLDLDQAIARLATSKPTFYRWLHSGRIQGLKVGRQWRFRRADIEAFLHGRTPAEVLTADIGPLQRRLAGHLAAAGVAVETGDPDPLVATIAMMLRLGAALGASDMHLEAEHDDETPQLRLRFRVSGLLHEYARADQRLLAPIVQQIKRMAACDLNEKRLPQDGRILARIGGHQLDLRVCFLPGNFGETLTMRFLSRDAVRFALQQLPFTPANLQRLEGALAQPSGLIVITGPTGSGKTTTAYACLTRLATPERKVISLEDPVEFRLPGMTQLNLSGGIPMAHALRACLRSDPDVLHLVSLRDREAAQGCAQAALTGHLVLAQMPCPDAVSALLRLVELGLDAWEVAETMQLVLAQRLLRKPCTQCSIAAEPDGAVRDRLHVLAREGGVDPAGLPGRWRRAVGCGACGGTGYRGRLAINETLAPGAELLAALRRGAPAAELRRHAISQGMTTLAAEAVQRAAAGESTPEEVLRVVGR